MDSGGPLAVLPDRPDQRAVPRVPLAAVVPRVDRVAGPRVPRDAEHGEGRTAAAGADDVGVPDAGPDAVDALLRAVRAWGSVALSLEKKRYRMC